MLGQLITLIVMCFLLGFGAFGIGMLPLTFAFRKQHTSDLQTVGTGLLLGTALGVIIPEGIESLVSSHPSSELPMSKIALSLLTGFTFMLLVEQFHSHAHTPRATLPLQPVNRQPEHSNVVFDENLGDLARENSVGHPGPWLEHFDPASSAYAGVVNQIQAYPLTLGLLVHGLADGFALGVSALSTQSGEPSSVSFVVFLALLIHKAPTALALTTNLMTTTLTRAECRYHLAAFSASTPFGALLSYGIFSFLGASQGEGDWTGIALLLSGGSFLYVATVIQPVSPRSSSTNEMDARTRTLLLVLGIFVPFAIGTILGHGHDHALHHEGLRET